MQQAPTLPDRSAHSSPSCSTSCPAPTNVPGRQQKAAPVPCGRWGRSSRYSHLGTEPADRSMSVPSLCHLNTQILKRNSPLGPRAELHSAELYWAVAPNRPQAGQRPRPEHQSSEVQGPDPGALTAGTLPSPSLHPTTTRQEPSLAFPTLQDPWTPEVPL